MGQRNAGGMVRHGFAGAFERYERHRGALAVALEQLMGRRLALGTTCDAGGRQLAPLLSRQMIEDHSRVPEVVEITGTTTAEQAMQWFEASMTAAKTQGERLFSELLGEHRSRLKEERERAKYAYDARYQAIGRIGLPAVREHRRKRLNAEHQARMAALDDAEASVPDLNAVMMLRVGPV
mgnify:CR=1 FL=1